jgi:hypothetical protein
MSALSKAKLAIATVAGGVLMACGGSGDSVAVSDAGGYTVESGVAQKGPLAQGSVVTVDELTSTKLQPNGKEYTFRTSNNLGTFSTSGITFGSSYLSTLASGYYYNEITGAQSNDIVVLSGLSQVGTGGDTVINVNSLSSMAVNRVTKLATVAPVKTFAVARAQAQRELLSAFFIYNGTGILTGTTVNKIAQPANLTALDLSKSRSGDEILAAMSGVVMTAGVNGNGVNTLLSQIAVDLGDDGLLNNSTNYRTSVQSKLCAAAAVTDFANVAANLNNLYGTTYSASDLSQWVDTSGCVDQVINKYKFSASNVAVGTVSRSPAYTIGADDVGQCFSVGGVTTGATAGLYYNSGATAVVGTQRVKAGDRVATGINASTAGSFSGFIQRSAPAANGTCPTVVPLNGLTRVEKYTTNDGYTVGGTVSGLTTGQSVTVLNNGGNAVTVSANGSFTFANTLGSGAAYAVTVGTQPISQTCTLGLGTGANMSSNISNIIISCKRIPTLITIINLNAQLAENECACPSKLINLSPGTYTVKYLLKNEMPGALYTAWNRWANPAGEWTSDYGFYTPNSKNVSMGYGTATDRYATPELAAEAAKNTNPTFSLSVTESVLFLLGDPVVSDNLGGVSIALYKN